MDDAPGPSGFQKLKLKLQAMKEENLKRRNVKEKEKYERKKKLQREKYWVMKHVNISGCYESTNLTQTPHKETVTTYKISEKPSGSEIQEIVKPKKDAKTKEHEGKISLNNTCHEKILSDNKKNRNSLDLESKNITVSSSDSTIITKHKNTPDFKIKFAVRKATRKLTGNAAVEKKKAANREKQRRHREKIRQNPDHYEKYKENERERNKKRKEMGQRQPIENQSTREQRIQRKKWRDNSRRYRMKKKSLKHLQENTPPNTPPDSPVLDLLPVIPDPKLNETPNGRKQNAGRRKLRKDRAKAYRTINKLQKSLKLAETKLERYKKREYRRKVKNMSNSPSPNTKVETILRQPTPEVKKRLLFGECVIKQIIDTSKECKSEDQKKMLASVVTGPVFKKYRVMKQAATMISLHRMRHNMKAKVGQIIKKRRNTTNRLKIQNRVLNFLLQDDNTIIGPGRRDTVTRKKIVRQKRYMTTSIKNLHRKFCAEHKNIISYSRFNSFKPFYVVAPKVSNRDTCLCMKHKNFEYLLEKMHQLKIINIKTPYEICKQLACNSNKKQCMYRECSICRDRKFMSVEGNLDKNIFYYKWISKTEDRIDKNKKPIKVRITLKEKITCTVKELIESANSSLSKFLEHDFNARHQFVQIKKIKETLKENEAVLHIDFSENYSCKYASEIQSAHFGASKPQISLHTCVLYYKKGNEILHKSFVTVSNDLAHGPSAIWAHLKPVITELKKEVQPLNSLSFVSDGPTTQYRNKTNFYLLMHFGQKYNINKISWNFTEAGHGKSAADGVGGALKKMADTAVSHGYDILNAEQLVDVLLKTNPESKISLFIVDKFDITANNGIAPQNLKPIKNTMRIHQIIWYLSNFRVLNLRFLSCLDCELGCDHFGLVPQQVHFDYSNLTDILNPQKKSMTNAGALPEFKMDVVQNKENLNPQDWVAVVYDNTWYPGIIEHISVDILTVSFMQPTPLGDKFFWPKKADRQTICSNGILCKIKPPVPVSNRHFLIKDTSIITSLKKKLLD